MQQERSVPSWQGAGLREVTTAWGDLATDVADAFESFLGAMAPGAAVGRPTARPVGRHRSVHRERAEPCRGCREDRCQCRCCITDADLVVYARLGELRVVPVTISNERKRSRQVELELSEFTSSGGREVPVRGRIVTRTEFELQGCEQEKAVVLIQASGSEDAPSVDHASGQGRMEDVDDCLVGYADLRVQGCDVRPVRIAVALLPRDCDAYEVRCGCGCC